MADYIQNLTIESFRGIHDLELKNLQPVNILTGDNNCGKTSVLEVIRSFTNPTDFRVWRAIIRKNFVASGTDISYFEGFYDLFDIDEERKSVSYRVTVENNAKIQQHQIILTADEVEKEMTETEYLEKQGIFVSAEEKENEQIRTVAGLEMYVRENEGKWKEERIYEGERNYLPAISSTGKNRNIVYISPTRHVEGAVYLSKILDYPELYEQMLSVLREYDEEIISLNYDKEERSSRGCYKILSRAHKKALPLNVYGDGMKKAVLLMSAVIEAKDGILLLDEFETAIHTSAMEKTFRWILMACKKMNVQIFLTSHSKEAIEKLLKCTPERLEEMALYTLYKEDRKSSVRRLSGRKAIEVQDEMGLELR